MIIKTEDFWNPVSLTQIGAWNRMKLFIGNIPLDYDEATIQECFEEFGLIHEVTIMRKGTLELTPYKVFINDDSDDNTCP